MMTSYGRGTALFLLMQCVPAIATAQQVFAVTANGKEIASEALQRGDDSVTTAVHVEGVPYTVNARLVSARNAPSAFDMHVVMPDGSELASVAITIADSTAHGIMVQRGVRKELDTHFDAQKPLVVFENMMFGLVGSEIAGLAAGEAMPIQVLIARQLQLQTWTLKRESPTMISLTTPEAIRMEWTFDGQRLVEMRVPAQQVVVKPRA